ncbi:amino acid ABC transporter permease [Schumannella luteola]|uniref:Polar amino acid transport system permease protein n=1 Tax=Schumannella luteola TaxID=472059 RepID=A0A852Y8P6_9MICO|nr:amino acid ABC transporter permease [Schumannella luteola]NYG98783.1 polar amino acid transport system permease protein [Schumannella luteola]TPX01619.1 amino acid ABC transporter permease [Schumannella luteola]
MNYNFDWSVVTGNIPELLNGLLTTLEIAVIVIVLSMILAAPVAIARMSSVAPVRWIAQIYIEIFRCTPLLVQLFWIFYALPTLTGITLPGFASAVIALTLNLTAFMAEAYRSGFQAVPKEQIEAAQMLRLTPFERTIHIIIPQALRQQLPVILSLNISLFKDTALVSTIAVADLMFVSNSIVATSYRSLEMFTVAALVYFVIAFPVSLVTSKIERNMIEGNERGGGSGPSLLSRMLPGNRTKAAVTTA